jgi:hypothetical protein
MAPLTLEKQRRFNRLLAIDRAGRIPEDGLSGPRTGHAIKLLRGHDEQEYRLRGPSELVMEGWHV